MADDAKPLPLFRMFSQTGLRIDFDPKSISILALAEKGAPEEAWQLDLMKNLVEALERGGVKHEAHTRNTKEGDKVDLVSIKLPSA